MEEKKLNEKESLELITRMIQNSKKNLQLERGNILLLWGYLCAITGIVVYALLQLTGNTWWNCLWFAIPAIGYPVTYWQNKKMPKAVLTYTDNVLSAVWKSIGYVGTAIVIILCFSFKSMPMILPLVLILCSTGICITGSIIKDKWMYNSSSFTLGIGAMMLMHVVNPPQLHLEYPMFSICFIFMMIIPGHRLNKESKRLCSKN